MLGIFFAVIVLLVIIAAASRVGAGELTMLLGSGYLLRLVLCTFTRELPFFSHGAGGDCNWYEQLGHEIATLWRYSGVFFVTKDVLPDAGNAALHINLIALIDYANGGPTRIGCEALIAGLAAISLLLLYRMAIRLGANRRAALLVTAVLYFSPGFLLYTSDLYKDGIVVFLEVLAFTSAMELSRKLTLFHAVVAACALFLLWFVRYYLVFATAIPVALAVVGLYAKGSARSAILGAAAAALVVALVAYTRVLGEVSEAAGTTLELATSQTVAQDLSTGGSAVAFESQGFGPTLLLKFLYTMFGPFPWQAGSIGLHIGKIDALINAYFCYRGAKAARRLWADDKTVPLLFLSFIAPMIFMYAITFVNMGLVLRERLSACILTGGLAMLSWPRAATGDERAAIVNDRSGEPIAHAA